MYSIKHSVGRGAKNDKEDVAIVQQLINNTLLKRASRCKPLTVNGLIGEETSAAILYVQQYVVMLKRPDGVVDPKGLTIKVMRKLMSAPSGEEREKPRTTDRIIILDKSARPVLSEYTSKVLQFAMALSDVNRIRISSTLRLVSDQARIMYNDNVAAGKAGVSLRTYRTYGYGKAGTAVDKVYADNHGKLTADEVKQKMEDEIIRWLKQGERTSKHCVEQSVYDRNNILDIPYSGVLPTDKKDEMESTLIGLANSFNYRQYSEAGAKELENYHKLKVIDKVIVERACWHLEIPQDAKELPKT